MPMLKPMPLFGLLTIPTYTISTGLGYGFFMYNRVGTPPLFRWVDDKLRVQLNLLRLLAKYAHHTYYSIFTKHSSYICAAELFLQPSTLSPLFLPFTALEVHHGVSLCTS
jgi:hypothetical protein